MGRILFGRMLGANIIGAHIIGARIEHFIVIYRRFCACAPIFRQKKQENGEGIRFPAVNVLVFTEKEGDGLAILPVKGLCCSRLLRPQYNTPKVNLR